MADEIKKQKILDELKLKLKTISTANNFHTELGKQIFENRTIPFSDDEIPAVNIRETDDQILDQTQQNQSQIFEHMLQLYIDIVTIGNLTPEELRKAEADVNKIIRENQTWNGNAIATYLVTTATEYAEHDEYKAMKKTIVIDINYKTLEWSI